MRVGVFDGVHRGHRYLLDCARSTAAETGGASVALTFDILFFLNM